jgi:hypothetical protein
MTKTPARLAVALLLLTACSGDSTQPAPTVNGRWEGEIRAIDAELTLTLMQEGEEVTGTGFIASGTTSISLDARGTFRNPDLELTLRSPGYEPVDLAGELDGEEIDARLEGSGFTGQRVTLERQ